MALSVECICASWSGCAPKPPVISTISSTWSWGSQKNRQTCLFVPTTHNIFDHFVSVKSFLVLHDVQRSKAPVHCVHAQVGSEMICEIIFIL